MLQNPAANFTAPRRLWMTGAIALCIPLALFCLSCAKCAQTKPRQSPLAEKQTTKKLQEHAPVFLSRHDTRAMWLWDETPGSQALIENRDDAQDELLAFLGAPHDEPARAVNRLFFAAHAHTRVDPLEAPHTLRYNPLLEPNARPQLQRLLRRLSDQGVATELLAGQAIWLASDKFAQIPTQICRDTVAFNLKSSDPKARFAGVHFDIEPHTVTRGPWAGEWWQDRQPGGYNAAWTQRWQQILSSCRQILDAYQAQTGQKLTLSSDVGTDFAHYNKSMRDFINRPDGPLDYLVVLNYFDARDNKRGQPAFFYGAHDGEQIVGGVLQNLEKWSEIPIMIAVETGPEKIAPDPTSFYQEGYQSMNQTLDKLLADHAAPPLIGVAIHHYAPYAYRDMKP